MKSITLSIIFNFTNPFIFSDFLQKYLQLDLSVYKTQLRSCLYHEFLNIMKFDAYLFAHMMKHQILCQYNRKLIITQNICRTFLFILQFTKHLMKLNCLTVVEVISIYSTSTIADSTTCCFFDGHEIASILI